LGERTPCKNRLISTLDKVINFKGTFLGCTKRLHVILPKNLFAEFLFAEKYCFNFAENLICGIADLPIFY
jgi:hypothetical protein